MALWHFLARSTVAIHTSTVLASGLGWKGILVALFADAVSKSWLRLLPRNVVDVVEQLRHPMHCWQLWAWLR